MISERADGLTISPKAEIGYFTQTGYKFNTHNLCSLYAGRVRVHSCGNSAVLASMGISE